MLKYAQYAVNLLILAKIDSFNIAE